MNEVSLGNVLVAAELGRAPVVAESAGYVALAVADQLLRAPVSVDEASVVLSTEGMVVIEGARAASANEAEASVRALLASLLSVSKGATPALGAAARRAAGGGIQALVSELEGALIPVNRGAAKRAIARLARETSLARESGALRGRKPRKVVSAPPPPRREAPAFVAADVAPEPPLHVHVAVPTPPPMPVASPPPLFVDDVPTPVLHVDEGAQLPLFQGDEEVIDADAIELSRPIVFDDDGLTPVDDGMTHRLPRSTYEHTLPLRFGEPPAELAALSVQPVIVVPLPQDTPAPPTEPLLPRKAPASVRLDPPPPPKDVYATHAPRSVDQLLRTFDASTSLPEHEVRNLLKKTAGLDPTALPPAVAPAESEHPELVAADEEPKAEAAPEEPAPPEAMPEVRLEPPANPRAGMGVMFFLLLLALGGAVFAWVKFPWLFTGHR